MVKFEEALTIWQSLGSVYDEQNDLHNFIVARVLYLRRRKPMPMILTLKSTEALISGKLLLNF